VHRNKGNYVPHELHGTAWKTRRSQVSRSFLIFRDGIYCGCPPARANCTQKKTRNIPPSPRLQRTNIRKASFTFRCYTSTVNPYLCGIENPILHRAARKSFLPITSYSDFSEYYILIHLQFSLGSADFYEQNWDSRKVVVASS